MSIPIPMGYLVLCAMQYMDELSIYHIVFSISRYCGTGKVQALIDDCKVQAYIDTRVALEGGYA